MSNTVSVIVKVTDQATSPLKGITGALGGMATVAGGIVSADLLGKIGEGFMGAARLGFDFNRSVENATARLNAFTKDTAVSTEILNQLRTEAAKTPFAFEDMANSGAALLPIANQLNMDLMDLVRTAEVLAASNPAEGLEGAAFALKEAASGDFASIIERFNLSRQTINRLKEEGVPAMEIVAQAMAEMGLDMDLVSNMATTFDGRMSTLMDTITNLAGAFTEPIFAFFSEQLGLIQTGLDGNIVGWETWARGVGQSVADSMQTFTEAWNGKWEDSEIIQPVHRFVGKTTLAVKEMWDKTVSFGNEYGPKIGAAWDTITRAVEDSEPVWGSFNGVIASSSKLFGELWRLGGLIIERWGPVKDKTDDVAGSFKEALTVGEALKGFLDLIIIGINRMTAAVSAAADAWARLNGTMASGPKQSGGGPVGPGDVPDTEPGVIVPIPPPPGPGDTPDTGPGGAIVPIPPPNKAAMQGKGTTTTTQQRGGNTYIFNISYPMDMEEAAYHISKIQQRERST